MKEKYWLTKRGSMFYSLDSETRQRKSLGTTDRHTAQKIIQAKNESTNRPALGLSLAKAYLAAYDETLVTRTWRFVMEEYCTRGQQQSQDLHRRKLKHAAFDPLRDKRLIETTSQDFMAALRVRNVFVHSILKNLHNLALGMGWLPWPVLAPKLWPKLVPAPKRGIMDGWPFALSARDLVASGSRLIWLQDNHSDSPCFTALSQGFALARYANGGVAAAYEEFASLHSGAVARGTGLRLRFSQAAILCRRLANPEKTQEQLYSKPPLFAVSPAARDPRQSGPRRLRGGRCGTHTDGPVH